MGLITNSSSSFNAKQIVKVLLGTDDAIAIDKVDVNLKNKNNLTALDMFDFPEKSTSEADANWKSIRRMLQDAGALQSQDIVILQHENPSVCFNCLPQKLRKYLSEQVSSFLTCELWLKLKREVKNSPSEMRSAVMVVAVLIATVTFQAVLSPPGGFQQPNDGQHSNGMAAISSDVVIFIALMLLNLVGFISSIVMILMLVSGFPLKLLLQIAVLATTGSFLITIFYIGPTKLIVPFTVAMIMAAIVLLQVLLFIVWLGRRFVNFGSCCGASIIENNDGV